MEELEAAIVEMLLEEGLSARVAVIKIGYPRAVYAKRIFIGSKLAKTEFCFKVEEGLLKELDGFFAVSLANPGFIEELKRYLRWMYLKRTGTRNKREKACRFKVK